MLLIGADEQRGRERVKAALLRRAGRLKQAHLVALDAPARDILRDLTHERPQAVIVAHEQRQIDRLRVFLQTVAPGAVFGERMDVRVVPIPRQLHPLRTQRIDRHIRTRRTADVHQQFHNTRLPFG